MFVNQIEVMLTIREEDNPRWEVKPGDPDSFKYNIWSLSFLFFILLSLLVIQVYRRLLLGEGGTGEFKGVVHSWVQVSDTLNNGKENLFM